MQETDFATKISSTEADVIAFYDEYADTWDDRFQRGLATDYFLERRWRSFAEAVDASGVVCGQAVELGVGTGVNIERAAKIFRQITAVDGSRGMLHALQQKLHQRRHQQRRVRK